MRRGRSYMLVGIALVTQTTACATVFREPKAEVRFASVPQEVEVEVQGRPVGPTPTVASVARSGSTHVTMSKAGRQVHRGYVRKSLNGAWVTVDILTCVIPVALCVPLLVDAISGAWIDVEDTYEATLEPGAAMSSPAPSAPVPGTPGPSPEELPGAAPELRL